MKKLILFFFSLIAIAGSLSAQNFYPFEYMGKEGLTNDSAVEMVAPLYKRSAYIETKNLWVFTPPFNLDGENIPACTFDETSRQIKHYASFHTDAVTIGNSSYSRVEDSKGWFLWSETTDRKIRLKKKYGLPWFKNIGERYIICSYYGYIKTKPAPPVPKAKNVPFQIAAPEPSDSSVTFIDVLANNDSIPVLLSGQYASYRPLYAYDENAQVINLNAELTGLLCSNGNTHTLYDSLLKKIASFKMAMPDMDRYNLSAPDDKRVEAILAHCSKLLHTNVVFNFPAYPNNIMASPNAANTDPSPVGKAPKPYLSRERMDEGEYLIINYPDGLKRTVLYTKHLIGTNDNWVNITKQGSDESAAYFYVDIDNGRVMFPEKYANALEITVY